jgi:2-amino-4-hydroxy-6-hydroxymethyldihydropteridine diphosphokinase
MGDSKKILKEGLELLSNYRGVKIKKVSNIIQTEPYGGVAKNIFYNCAAEVECLLSPKDLLCAIHEVEEKCGRVRKERWGDRTLDIDIIFFGDKIIADSGLSVPHLDYANRDFVIIPIKEIAPDFVCPDTRKRVSDL